MSELTDALYDQELAQIRILEGFLDYVESDYFDKEFFASILESYIAKRAEMAQTILDI